MNECLILIGSYGLMVFTEFVPDVETRYKNGWAMIAVVAFTIGINMMFLIGSNIKDICRKIKLAWLRYK